MTPIDTSSLIDLFSQIARAIEADKERLSRLDGVIGDADHGVTMAIGFNAVKSALRDPNRETSNPSTVFNTAAKSFLNAVGASTGPLYATAFMRAAAAVKGKSDLDRDALVAVVSAMAKGIQERGKGELGDKTMLDAWLPAAAAAEAAATKARTRKAALKPPSKPPRRALKPLNQWWLFGVGPLGLATARLAIWILERPPLW